MRSAPLLEWTLARFTTREHATSILGDLLETAEQNGSLWFWLSFLRILGALTWRSLAPWIFAYAVGRILLWLSMDLFVLWEKTVQLQFAQPLKPAYAPLVAIAFCIAEPLWFLAPYCVLRFGLRDRLTQLALALGSLATVAIIVEPLQWLAAAFTAGAIVLALLALCSRHWRRQCLTLALSNAAGLLITLGSLGAFISLFSHHIWGPDLNGTALHIRELCSFGCFILAFSRIYTHLLQHSKSGSSIPADASLQ